MRVVFEVSEAPAGGPYGERGLVLKGCVFLLWSPKPLREDPKEKCSLFLKDMCFFEVAEAPAGGP